MVSQDRKLANAVTGISARACDNCVKKRARWYCTADDAFLCQSCDSSIHSANPMSRRHERVRLKMGSFRSNSMPSWHQGFTRKSRTLRQKKIATVCSDDGPVSGISNNSSHLVPEIGDSRRVNDEQILHRVPVFDSLLDSEFGEFSQEMNLAEFAADFESFLGNGMEDAWFEMEGLGIPEDCDEIKATESKKHSSGIMERAVKIEDEDAKPDPVPEPMQTHELDCNNVHDSKKMLLRLDYNGVISAWDDHKSPWTTGERLDLNSSAECWPYCLGMCGRMHLMGVRREARVMRYREKRRTRLFSKKIRYQVRKMNADKRPRIKGRFVKTPIFIVEE